jgi:hypothetical protein
VSFTIHNHCNFCRMQHVVTISYQIRHTCLTASIVFISFLSRVRAFLHQDQNIFLRSQFSSVYTNVTLSQNSVLQRSRYTDSNEFSPADKKFSKMWCNFRVNSLQQLDMSYVILGPFEKFVDSHYYSESELCGGAMTVSFSKYLPWQAIHFI